MSGSESVFIPPPVVVNKDGTTTVEQPPEERGQFVEPDLVDLEKFDPRLILDIRYATTDNFTGRQVYPTAKAFLQRPAAEALSRVNERLLTRGIGLVIYDGYRPWSVTKFFWDVTPPESRNFVADPAQGSRHNRGCAVDLGLIDLTQNRPLEMPSGYDEFTERAYPAYAGGSAESRANRETLRLAMEAEGFAVYRYEWWHFDFPGWEKYRIMDLPFEKLG